MLYYEIGKYISVNSRKGFWGKGAIDTISEKLQKDLPGLRDSKISVPKCFVLNRNKITKI